MAYFAGAMNHGLYDWIATELGACYVRIAALEGEGRANQERIEELTAERDTINVQLGETVGDLVDSRTEYDRLVRMTIISNLDKRRMREALEDLTRETALLKQNYAELETENKGLARALRRRNTEVEEAKREGWLAKKPKLD